MDFHSIVDHDSGGAGPQPDESRATEPAAAAHTSAAQADVRFPGEDGGRSLAEMAERDLAATLQLLADRAQYITGATGAAIALRDHEEMVCRASAGPSAPEVGAQLQVNSGLSGESVRTRQTLRCDDAFTDTRVNRESCEALGIRSVVVMPLLRGEEVIGVFELFSDQANVFETRDLAALERMGAMVHAALEHSAAALGLEPLPPDQTTRPALPDAGNGHHEVFLEPLASDHGTEIISPVAHNVATSMPHAGDAAEAPASSTSASPGIAFHMKMPAPSAPVQPPAEAAEPAPLPMDARADGITDEGDILEGAAAVPTTFGEASSESDDILLELAEARERPASNGHLSSPRPTADESPAMPSEAVPPRRAPESQGAVAHLRKCEVCGFPVSEGRQLCLDCEKKTARQSASPASQATAPQAGTPLAAAPVPPSTANDVPNFLAGGEPEASWFSTHKLAVVAIAIAVVGIVAAVLLR